MNVPLVLLNRRRRGGAFSPTRLFSLSEPGVWYDPSDVANLAWRRNLLTFTEQFDNAAWVKANSTVTANAGTAPDGTMTADRLVDNTSAVVHVANQTISVTSSTTYTLSFYAKASGRNWVTLDPVYPSVANNITYFDLANGAIGTSDPDNSNVTIIAVGNGWYRCSLRHTTAVGQTSMIFQIAPANANNGISYIGSGTDGVLIWGAQLELGSTATDYQRISDVNTEVIERFPTATLYQDTAGTQPVTTPGQTVALALDKSRGLVLGSEIVVNGNFATDTDWVKGTGWTISGGVASYNGTDAPNAIYQSAANLDSGKSYRVSITVSLTQGALLVRPSFNSTAGQYQINSSGTYSILLSGQGGQFGLIAGSSGGRFIGSIDNISVKELPGNHATQATVASRPTYGIVPRTGRRNLLTFTEQFDNAVWSKSNATISANNGAAPDSATTADLFYPTATGTSLIFTGSAARPQAISCYAKASGKQWVAIGTNTNTADVAFFNLQTGTVGAVGANMTSAAIQDIGSGWYRVSVVATTAAAGAVGCAFFVTDANSSLSVTASGTSGILIWGAQLETGSTATAYQRVGSAFDVTEAGVASLSYLSFDGIDDHLVTPTITPGVDKAQVFAGVRKLSDAAIGVVAEFSTNSSSTTAGVFGLIAPRTVGATYGTHLRGTARMEYVTASSFAAPISNVLSALYDIAQATAELENRLRVNGAAQTLSVVDAQAGPAGTGDFSAQPLYIGRRAGTSLPFNGQIYSLIVRFGTNLDAATITNTETWVGGKTGVTL